VSDANLIAWRRGRLGSRVRRSRHLRKRKLQAARAVPVCDYTECQSFTLVGLAMPRSSRTHTSVASVSCIATRDVGATLPSSGDRHLGNNVGVSKGRRCHVLVHAGGRSCQIGVLGTMGFAKKFISLYPISHFPTTNVTFAWPGRGQDTPISSRRIGSIGASLQTVVGIWLEDIPAQKPISAIQSVAVATCMSDFATLGAQ
jgi:hypothetical protein